MQEKKTTVSVRLPDDLHEKISALSSKYERSLNKQIIFMLRDLLDLTRNKSEAPSGEGKISSFSSARMQRIPAALNGNPKGKPAKRLASLPVA